MQQKAHSVAPSCELRTRESEECGNRRKLTVKQRVCEIALESMLKLDRVDSV